MPLAVTVSSAPTKNLKQFAVRGTIVASGNYPTGGDVFNLITATYPVGQSPVPSTSSPTSVLIFSQPAAGSGATGLFEYGFLKGTTAANGKMQVFTGAAAQSALAELSAGAYPAGVTGDAIQFIALFDAV